MKKKFLLFLIVILYFFIIIKSFSSASSSEYKIVRIVDADTFYIDYNKDGYAQKNEKVRIKHSDGFETSFKSLWIGRANI